jgi:hypothetical protein
MIPKMSHYSGDWPGAEGDGRVRSCLANVVFRISDIAKATWQVLSIHFPPSVLSLEFEEEYSWPRTAGNILSLLSIWKAGFGVGGRDKIKRKW